MAKKEIIYLEYLPEFDAYGIQKSVIEQLTQQKIVAEILLPEKVRQDCAQDAPTIGFLLGQDKSENGDEYYSIGENYLKAVLSTDAHIRFLDYDNPYQQMKDCDGAVLPGGAFNNPEHFYIDGQTLGEKIGKRYFAYRSVIAEAYKKHKPMLGICAGAQMIGAILGNMKMYRDLKREVLHPALHKPKKETDVRVHQIKLLKNTPIFEIMGLSSTEDRIMINSRHNQSMALDVLQDYLIGTPKVKMQVYAISESDNIPEIWGSEKAGILCVQGHPEDLIDNEKMQNLYHYIARKAKEYKTRQNSSAFQKNQNIR